MPQGKAKRTKRSGKKYKKKKSPQRKGKEKKKSIKKSDVIYKEIERLITSGESFNKVISNLSARNKAIPLNLADHGVQYYNELDKIEETINKNESEGNIKELQLNLIEMDVNLSWLEKNHQSKKTFITNMDEILEKSLHQLGEVAEGIKNKSIERNKLTTILNWLHRYENTLDKLAHEIRMFEVYAELYTENNDILEGIQKMKDKKEQELQLRFEKLRFNDDYITTNYLYELMDEYGVAAPFPGHWQGPRRRGQGRPSRDLPWAVSGHRHPPLSEDPSRASQVRGQEEPDEYYVDNEPEDVPQRSDVSPGVSDIERDERELGTSGVVPGIRPGEPTVRVPKSPAPTIRRRRVRDIDDPSGPSSTPSPRWRQVPDVPSDDDDEGPGSEVPGRPLRPDDDDDDDVDEG